MFSAVKRIVDILSERIWNELPLTITERFKVRLYEISLASSVIILKSFADASFSYTEEDNKREVIIILQASAD